MPQRPTAALAALAAILSLASACCAGCAAPGSHVDVGPLGARFERAGGGTELELLGGIWFSRAPEEADAAGGEELWALRPLVSRRTTQEAARTRFLAPLGSALQTSEGTTSYLLPLYYYRSHEDELGARHRDLLTLLGILWSQSEDPEPGAHKRELLAWFPFAGRARNFLTFDEIDFFLFPLYLRTLREGRRNWHFLFPIFNRSSGGGGSGWHVWPLYGENALAGRYDRRFLLWPVFHWHRNDLDLPEELQQEKLAALPFFGTTSVGSYRSWTVLWPFFGWAHDRERGFWALDCPWPLVRLQRGGQNPPAEERTRVWPFYSHYRSAGLEATSYAWPIFQRRSEDYGEVRRESTYLVPFWQHWERTDARATGAAGATPLVESWTKLWPLYQESDVGGARRTAFPALSPLWRLEEVEFHYSWLWELYAREEDPDGAVHERGWLGLWRRERDQREVRTALGPLWARRGDPGGSYSEHSLLFGLLRWRHDGEGWSLLAPAFPGPGWPGAEPAP
jgi:hypothetical protein